MNFYQIYKFHYLRISLKDLFAQSKAYSKQIAEWFGGVYKPDEKIANLPVYYVGAFLDLPDLPKTDLPKTDFPKTDRFKKIYW